jgi:hypothetical protein
MYNKEQVQGMSPQSTATETCGHCSKKCEPGMSCGLFCDNQICSEDCRYQCPWQPDLLPSLTPKCTIAPPEGFRLATDDSEKWEGQRVADHEFMFEPIPGVLIEAGYVAFPEEGDVMEEEEGAQGSRGDRKRRRGSGTGGGRPGRRSRREHQTRGRERQYVPSAPGGALATALASAIPKRRPGAASASSLEPCSRWLKSNNLF